MPTSNFCDDLIVEHADLNAQADPAAQASTYNTLVSAGILSRAQVRRGDGLPVRSLTDRSRALKNNLPGPILEGYLGL